MCLAIPGKVISIEESGPTGLKTARVSFGGTVKNVCLEYVPETKVGEYVLVHVGFALSRLDEKEAQKTFDLLKELDFLTELADGQP